MADLLRTYHLEVSSLADFDNFKAFQESDAGRAAYPIARSSGHPLGASPAWARWLRSGEDWETGKQCTFPDTVLLLRLENDGASAVVLSETSWIHAVETSSLRTISGDHFVFTVEGARTGEPPTTAGVVEATGVSLGRSSIEGEGAGAARHTGIVILVTCCLLAWLALGLAFLHDLVGMICFAAIIVPMVVGPLMLGLGVVLAARSLARLFAAALESRLPTSGGAAYSGSRDNTGKRTQKRGCTARAFVTAAVVGAAETARTVLGPDTTTPSVGEAGDVAIGSGLPSVGEADDVAIGSGLPSMSKACDAAIGSGLPSVGEAGDAAIDYGLPSVSKAGDAAISSGLPSVNKAGDVAAPASHPWARQAMWPSAPAFHR